MLPRARLSKKTNDHKILVAQKANVNDQVPPVAQSESVKTNDDVLPTVHVSKTVMFMLPELEMSI